MYTVLVCDDDVAILDSVEIYLKLEGYNVLRAENGIDAVEQVKNNEVHCVILDIMMPQLDGLQATLRLREKHNIPIILLSAKSEDTDKITGLSFGADDYVTKPFNPLDVSAEELTHRFVRGDASRSGEGNGLGLSIAKDLCELQKGKLMLETDGDLFKATVKLPVAK